ncbi:MAG: VOC family protein [Ignavibacteriae bacterium]|nr:VOC family protein [Ignavibacteriota bacterium]
MNRVIHFEIHADNPERAVTFYTDLFGWKFDKWDGPMPYWLVTTGPDGEPGINGGLMPRKGKQEGDIIMAYVCTVQVANVDESIAKALSSGGQTALPKMPVPGVGWLAYCKDTEGNIFGMMQNDKNAGM